MRQLSMFETQARELINKFSLENASNTPDYILAEFLARSLDAFNDCVILRDRHSGASQKQRTDEVTSESPNCGSAPPPA